MNDKKPPKKTETIEIRISHEKKNGFMAACRRCGTSASAVIRGFIDDYVADAERAPKRNSPKEFKMIRLVKSAAVAGFISTGVMIATPTAAADPRVAAVFQWYDSDRNGGVSLEEFVDESKNIDSSDSAIEISMTTKAVPFPDEPRDAMFRRLDNNNDGVLSLAELDRQVTVETVAKTSDAILVADLNGDGAVTAAEISANLTARWTTAGVADSAAGAALLAEGLVAAHDRNGDGAIEPAELSTP